MRAVDTNVLIRLIVQDNSQQTDAAKDFVRDGVWISTVALAETMWVLAAIYGHGPDRIRQAVAMMLDLPNAVLQDAEAVEEALDLFRARPSLGFSDCLLIALARKAGHLPLGTFDRRLAKVDGAHLIGAKSGSR